MRRTTFQLFALLIGGLGLMVERNGVQAAAGCFGDNEVMIVCAAGARQAALCTDPAEIYMHDDVQFQEDLYECCQSSTDNTDFHNCMILKTSWLCTTTLCC